MFSELGLGQSKDWTAKAWKADRTPSNHVRSVAARNSEDRMVTVLAATDCIRLFRGAALADVARIAAWQLSQRLGSQGDAVIADRMSMSTPGDIDYVACLAENAT